MNILITGQHLDLTPAIRAYVENKLDRVLRHFDQVIEVAVVLGVDTPADKERRHRAEVNLRVKGDVLHAESRAEDLYAAIDTLVEKLDRQVLKLKEKIKAHRQTGIKHIPEPEQGSEMQ
ncbi:MAG: ribosome hibernation-promoting factor, HPF/YfiA family [Burkholderiaceae bacterium]